MGAPLRLLPSKPSELYIGAYDKLSRSETLGRTRLMRLFRRTSIEDEREQTAVLLEDQHLMHRIDAFRAGEWQGDKDKHPDVCRSCGWIEPGARYCKRCGQEIRRKAKYGGFNGGFWFQEVTGGRDRQEAFRRVVAGVKRDADGGVHEWVNAILLPEPDSTRDKNAVRVVVLHGEDLDHVGYISPDEAPEIQRACLKVYAAHKRFVACKGLIQGGLRREHASAEPYGIRLLLPLPWNMLSATNAALVLRPEAVV